jgi:hypothetical protein
MVSFLSKLFGSLFGASRSSTVVGDRHAILTYVRCNACGEAIRLRISREHDLSAEFDEGVDAPTGYRVHKDVVGQQCFRRIEVDMAFDSQRKVTEQQIKGGQFITREAYEAATAEDAAGATPPATSSS